MFIVPLKIVSVYKEPICRKSKRIQECDKLLTVVVLSLLAEVLLVALSLLAELLLAEVPLAEVLLVEVPLAEVLSVVVLLVAVLLGVVHETPSRLSDLYFTEIISYLSLH